MVVISSRIEVKTPLVGTCSSSMLFCKSFVTEDGGIFCFWKQIKECQYLLETPEMMYVKEKRKNPTTNTAAILRHSVNRV